jgi:hypothetical protein
MQLLNLAFYGAALLTIAQAAPSPMRLDLSVNKDSPATVFPEACLMICMPEKMKCGGDSVSSSNYVSKFTH